MAEEHEEIKKPDLAHKLSEVGWALFFIWLGLSFLANFGGAISLLGIGVIILGMQIIRKAMKLNFEGFWLFIGLLFLLGGVGRVLEVRIPIIPIVLILAGMVMLYSIITKKNKTEVVLQNCIFQHPARLTGASNHILIKVNTNHFRF